MLKKRLIPVLLLKNGLLVRSELFKIHQIIGNPIYEVQRFNEWNVDELIYLDISREEGYDLRRNDHKTKGLTEPLQILDEVSKTCFMPLTWGGRIRTVEQMRQIISRGADKITINTAAVQNPELITQGAKIFGSQAIVVSIDVLRHPDGQTEVFIDGGHKPTAMKPEYWAKEVEERGAGEILLNSIDRDGTGQGYDLELINAVVSATKIPVIACGGVGRYEHYVEGIKAGASAIAAANIWHFKELSDRRGKRALAKAGIEVRL
ncbi:imidazole glycerol phosphate synthase cyclase subunit [Moorena sp. SIO3I6]|uniref:imidazole glycerol phosphate synthase subunit HisF n=1 Tax=Moorena sp. SIO3I6 TaxID=2607831 RepID=UPI0013FCB8CC|nr:imidazole glycerol phosphate synthase cyclase subunit [Moorena sp. SIO3I6]NEP27698.1 imidazole glycerol phosphate synthase subunit HisF [Moorena sp. SIO3I6]